MSPSPYIASGTQFNAAQRSIVVDWMIATSAKLRANNDTIHVAVNILDRFLAANNVHNSILQLVGVTALSIAFKFEEIHPLDLKDCVRLAKRAYTKQQIVDMEGDILSALGFSVNAPTSYKFLKRFVFLTKACKTMKFAAMYYLEKTLLKHQALAYRSSLLAAAACCLAINHPELAPNGSLHGVDTDFPGIVSQKQSRCASLCLTASSLLAPSLDRLLVFRDWRNSQSNRVCRQRRIGANHCSSSQSSEGY